MDYWEGYNEPPVSSVAEIQWYAEFEQARVEIMAAHGLKAVIGCFSLGTPDVTNPEVSFMCHQSLGKTAFLLPISLLFLSLK